MNGAIPSTNKKNLVLVRKTTTNFVYYYNYLRTLLMIPRTTTSLVRFVGCQHDGKRLPVDTASDMSLATCWLCGLHTTRCNLLVNKYGGKAGDRHSSMLAIGDMYTSTKSSDISVSS